MLSWISRSILYRQNWDWSHTVEASWGQLSIGLPVGQHIPLCPCHQRLMLRGCLTLVAMLWFNIQVSPEHSQQTGMFFWHMNTTVMYASEGQFASFKSWKLEMPVYFSGVCLWAQGMKKVMWNWSVCSGFQCIIGKWMQTTFLLARHCALCFLLWNLECEPHFSSIHIMNN